MDLTLSWDLFIIVFFGVVTAYSFIVGRNQTLKIILSTYVAILVADGLSNIFVKYMNPRILNVFFPGYDLPSLIIITKILLLIICIVILVIKGGFNISINDNSRGIRFIVTTFIFGMLSAGLIVSTLLYFISGGNFTHPLAATSSSALLGVQQGSLFVKNMVIYYDLWFSLPAIAFLVSSFIEGGGSEEE